jgi:Adenylate cyclase, family 3 (some proteins contain HAMP domain)
MGKNADSYTREELLRIFSRAIRDSDLEKILSLEPPLSRTIETREITSLFTDCRNATSFEASLGTAGACSLIVSVLEAIEEEAIKAGGYVDKFVGDEAMVLFGAPIGMSLEAQVKAACAVALEVKRRSAELGVRLGVGFNTGLVSIGCFSTRAKPMYTVMGDDVNIAARLEGTSKKSGDRPLLSEASRSLVGGEYRTVFFDELKIATRPEPLRVYARVGRASELSEDESALWDRYDVAIARLDGGDADAAVAIFASLAEEHPGDSLFETELQRASGAYTSAVGGEFAAAESMSELGSVLKAAVARLAGSSEIGLIEPGIDDIWRFRGDAPFSGRELILAPGGDALVWLKGLATAGGPRIAPGSAFPSPLDIAGFGAALPLRYDNELAAALFIGGEGKADAIALSELAKASAVHWHRIREAELGVRFREKYDDAAKLEEVNRELESKSANLERAMSALEDLNRGLEERALDAAAKLERAAELKRYLPPAVVEDIISGRKDLSPRTERRKITLLFSDIRGFTQATDGLEPEELARLLDEYLSAMSAIAFAAGATIDKFRGDGMMLFFGAPEPVEAREGALRCLRMAVDMCREVERLRGAWFDEGYDWDLGVRMGINTGYATVGEFGSAERMDYTAIGSEVNLAARLEGCCETDSIVVSHATWALIKDEYSCEPLGEVELKGIHKPVRAYRVNWKPPIAEA